MASASAVESARRRLDAEAEALALQSVLHEANVRVSVDVRQDGTRGDAFRLHVGPLDQAQARRIGALLVAGRRRLEARP